MSYPVAIILGLIQGMTEFLPISSSGHLIIARELLHINDFKGLAFDAVLQLASTLALLIYFRKDILLIIQNFWNMLLGNDIEVREKTLVLSIIVGTIPAVFLGIFLEEYMETVFRNIHLVAATLIAGSVLFWIAENIATQNKNLSHTRALTIGFFQCLSLVPGVSRSGATISGGLIMGLTKDEAVRFSFLLSIPILLGTGLKKLFDAHQDLLGTELGGALFVGSLVSFLTGLIAINFLIRYLKNHSLNLFIWYRIGLSIAIFLLF